MSITQIGSDINIETKSGNNSIDLNCFGNVVAVGVPCKNNDDQIGDYVQVYHNTGGSWVQMGSDIEPNRNGTGGEKFGYDVSLNSSGTILAVSDRGWQSNCGRVVFYSYDNGWDFTEQLMGNLIANVSSNANFGESLSLNSAGNVIVIGATGTSSYKGEARVFSNNGTNWEQLGGTIFGIDQSDYFGRSVDIDSSGSIVAISSTTHDVWKGHVMVFERNSGNTIDPTGWEQIGSDIDGNGDHQGFGQCVSLNNAGNVIAITGANRSGSGGWYTGVTRIYHREDGNTVAPTGWEQLGGDIEGETTMNYSDFDTDLNYNGNMVVIGASKGNVVRIFKRDSGNLVAPIGWEQVGQNIYGNFDEGFGHNVCINSSGNIVAAVPGSDITWSSPSTDEGAVRTYSVGTDEEFNCDPSVIGDPYITTISGITYKMDDFSGFARMLQGELGGKLFTLNAQSAILSSDEIYNLIDWRKKFIGQIAFTEGSIFADFPAYFSKLYVSWGEDSFIIDIYTLEIESSTYDVTINHSFGVVGEYHWSNKSSPASIAKIRIGKITLIIRSYENKDIRNGFSVKNTHLVKNRSGAIEHAIYTEDMRLSTLTSHAAIHPIKNSANKKWVTEEFIGGDGGKVVVKLPIF